jgi:adenine-specific DNA-methyltransferase
MADGRYKKGKYEDNRTLVTLLDDVVVKGGIVVSDFRVEGEWRYSQANLDEKVHAGERIEIKGTKFKPYWINNSERTKFVRTLLNKETYNVGTNEDGNEELARLLGNGIFDFPKPASLAQKLVEIASRHGSGFVLDFFCGSGTTGHAVLAQNAKDGGSRRFILVQLPEPVEKGSEAAKAGFETIADITKERVRRAAKEIAKEAGGASKLKLEDGSGPQDLGFRVFKLDTSNFRVWDAAAPAGDEAKLAEQLRLQVEHVESGRGGLDVVFEVLLKSKLPLTSKVEKVKVSGGEVWSVESGRLLVVVDEGVDLAGVRELSKRDPKPETVVFLDRCFGGKDALKANASKIFQDAGIEFKTI